MTDCWTLFQLSRIRRGDYHEWRVSHDTEGGGRCQYEVTTPPIAWRQENRVKYVTAVSSESDTAAPYSFKINFPATVSKMITAVSEPNCSGGNNFPYTTQ